MTPDAILASTAAALRDVIVETDQKEGDDPEETYRDLACRLLLKLRGQLTIVPIAATITAEKDAAAGRILKMLTAWLTEQPGYYATIQRSEDGKFEVVAARHGGLPDAFFRGDSVQDALGQITGVISMNEGKLE